MGTNKNKRASAKKQKAAAATTVATEKTKEPTVGQELPPTSSSSSSSSSEPSGGFSWPQLTGLIYLCIAVSWLVSYGKHAFSSSGAEGSTSTACADYVQNVESCSTVDIQMAQIKYFSGMLTAVTSSLAMMVCWFDQPMFVRLITMFCASPLCTTVLALQATREWMKPAQMAQLGFQTTAYLVTGAFTIAQCPDVEPMRLPKLNLRSMTLATLAAVQGYEIIRLGMEGVAGLIDVPLEDDVTDPATVLIYFLCVDRATMIGILFFALFYADATKQKKLLLFYGVCHFIAVAIQLPKMEEYLVDADYQRNLLFGSGMFSLTAQVAPDIDLFGGSEDSTSEEQNDFSTQEAPTQQSKKEKKKRKDK